MALRGFFHGALAASFGLLSGTLAGCAAVPEPADEGVGGEEPNGQLDSGVSYATVADAAASCTTASIKGLSQQIIDEVACVSPDAYALVPARPNLNVSDNVFRYLEKPG